VRALAWSSSLNQRLRLRGRSGGKGPGVGLSAPEQLDVSLEGQLCMRYSVARGALVQQPAHGIVRQHPAIELLAYEVGGLAAQNPPPLPQVRLEFVEDSLDLPALVVQRRQFHRRCQLRIQQRCQQPVSRLPVIDAGHRVLDHTHRDGLLGGLGPAYARGSNDAEEGAVRQLLLHRQLAGAAASPQQFGSRGPGVAPLLEAVESPVGHAQHAWLQPRQQLGAQRPLASAKGPEVGTQDRVRGAFDQHDAACLRVAGMPGQAGAAAGVAKDLGVVRLVRQIEAAAVDRHQSQAGVERLGMVCDLGQGHAAAPDQFAQRRRSDAAAQSTDGGLAHQRRLGRPAGPRQPLRDDGEDLFVRRLRVQAQRHAVVDTGHGGKAPDALAIAAMLVEYGMHDVGGNHTSQQAGR